MITALMSFCERLRRRAARVAWAFVALACFSWPVQAHKASDAYLQVQVRPGALSLRWDIALRDLENLVELDADGDRRLTWREVRHALPQIEAEALDHLAIPGCPLHVAERGLERRSDGTYVALTMHSACTPPAGLPMRYTLFAGVDATHRGIARITGADGRIALRLLDPAAPQPLPATASAAASAAPSSAFVFVRDGVHHILSGYDHLLFLLCLLLPSVLRRTSQGWKPVDHTRQALTPVLRIVTLFTVAHSITLTLAALGKVDLPSSIIEPAIAATIVVAALDNLRPVFGRWRGAVTFAFGLVHGFGFAGALRELNLPTLDFASALLRFNLGIELGQLLVVACVVPVLLWQRDRPAYPRWGLRLGSALAMVLAGLWFVERTADVVLLPI